MDASLTYLDSDRTDALVLGTDLVTELRPGLRYTSRSGRVQGSLSYALGLLHHRNAAASFQTQHQLMASFKAEAIEKRAFVDVTASIGKQALSAYGQQSADVNRTDNANLSEVANLSITPYTSGVLGDVAVYDLRLNASAVNTRRSIAGDSNSTGGVASVNSARSGALVGWGLTASSTTSEFRLGGKSTNDRATASVVFRPDPELSLTLRAGRESTNVVDAQKQAYSNQGGSVRWSPTERTVAELSVDKRYFGNSHALTFSHRFPLSSIRYTSQRDVTLSASPLGLGQPQTLYQLFFQQFASLEPDPALREQLVLAFLLGQGQDPGAAVGGGFVNTGPRLQQRHDLSWSYGAKRLTLALQAFANRSGLLDTVAAPAAGAEDLRQRGYNATASYRLTPTASLGLNGSRLMTKATPTQAGTDLKSLMLSYTDRLGSRSTAAVSARYSVFNASINPYREAALTASLATRF